MQVNSIDCYNLEVNTTPGWKDNMFYVLLSLAVFADFVSIGTLIAVIVSQNWMLFIEIGIMVVLSCILRLTAHRLRTGMRYECSVENFKIVSIVGNKEKNIFISSSYDEIIDKINGDNIKIDTYMTALIQKYFK